MQSNSIINNIYNARKKVFIFKNQLTMSIPRNLNHKPIIGVTNYDKIDSKYTGKTDAKALSIGKAQYDKDEISLKVFRIVKGKWSRQSEELPIHRNLDLSILFVASLLTDVDANYSKSSLREEIVDAGSVQNITDYYLAHESQLKPRLEELRKILETFLDRQ